LPESFVWQVSFFKSGNEVPHPQSNKADSGLGQETPDRAGLPPRKKLKLEISHWSHLNVIHASSES
jgi:hypothetical protein